MQLLAQVILPVFLVIGFGYIVAWRQLFSEAGIDGLMTFAQNFAIPCMLFLAIATLDLGQDFDLRLLGAFYAGATACFVLGIVGARVIFHRSWIEAVAIGFCCLFSNSLLLGLPITERAYGSGALGPNYAIIALHAPFCYALGITTMELVRNRGGGLVATAGRVVRAMFNNALVIGIALGFAVNLAGVTLPDVAVQALDLMVAAAIPAALFGLGGVLYRYRPEGDLRAIVFVGVIGLMVHPALVWWFGTALALDQGQFRSAVITAAMAPGVNAYVFANMYGAARRVAASAVLLGTAASVLTAWVWLTLLG